jgi:hypothetical protein
LTVIRHEEENIEAAKKDRLALYSLEIDRKYTIPSNRGGSFSSRGVCTAQELPVLMFAQRVLGYGMPIDKAMTMLREELSWLQEPCLSRKGS